MKYGESLFGVGQILDSLQNKIANSLDLVGVVGLFAIGRDVADVFGNFASSAGKHVDSRMIHRKHGRVHGDDRKVGYPQSRFDALGMAQNDFWRRLASQVRHQIESGFKVRPVALDMAVLARKEQDVQWCRRHDEMPNNSIFWCHNSIDPEMSAEDEKRLQEFVDKVDPAERAIVAKHQKLFKEIYYWYRLRDFLVEEIHKKKTKLTPYRGNKKGIFGNSISETFRPYPEFKKSGGHRFYRKVLFMGQKTIGNGLGLFFPDLIRWALQDLLFSEIKSDLKNNPLEYVYGSKSETESTADDFSAFRLSSAEIRQVTESDRDVFRMFARGMLAFIKRCVDMIRPTYVYYKNLVQFVRRCEKLFQEWL